MILISYCLLEFYACIAHFLREEEPVIIKQVVSPSPEMLLTVLSTDSGEKNRPQRAALKKATKQTLAPKTGFLG